MARTISREQLYIGAISVFAIGLAFSLYSLFKPQKNVALIQARNASEHSVTRREAWNGINEYRRRNPGSKTALIVHYDAALRGYINNTYVDLTKPGAVVTSRLGDLRGRPACGGCSWGVGFYYAINSSDQLTFYIIPVLIDENGDGLDFYTSNYRNGHPEYHFKPEGGAAFSMADTDPVAWNFGHIRPTFLK